MWRDIARLLDLAQRMKFDVPFRMGSLRDDFRYFCDIHSNLVSVTWDKTPRIVRLNPVKTSAVNVVGGNLSGSVVDRAVPRMILNSYGNTAMHIFARASFVALSFVGGKTVIRKDFAWRSFQFMQNLFAKEFVFVAEEEEAEFDETLESLCAARFLCHEDSIYRVGDAENLEVLQELMSPFLVAYWHVCGFLRRWNGSPLEAKVLVESVQSEIVQNMGEGICPQRYQMLSTDLLKNAVHSLVDSGGLRKVKENGGCWFSPNLGQIEAIQGKLETFMQEIPRETRIKAKM